MLLGQLSASAFSHQTFVLHQWWGEVQSRIQYAWVLDNGFGVENSDPVLNSQRPQVGYCKIRLRNCQQEWAWASSTKPRRMCGSIIGKGPESLSKRWCPRASLDFLPARLCGKHHTNHRGNRVDRGNIKSLYVSSFTQKDNNFSFLFTPFLNLFLTVFFMCSSISVIDF